MQPDRYELQWARARMHRQRAGTNHEAKQRMRNSSDPADHRALEILDADQAAIATDLAARKAAGLYPYERPLSIEEAERQRAADTNTGTGATGVVPENGRGTASPKDDPAGPVLESANVRTFDRQLKQLVATARRYIPDA